MPEHSLKSCPRCDTPLTGSEAACPGCKRPLAGPALAGAPAKKINCPVCKLPLYAASVVDQPALHCAECQGLAIERDPMMKLQPHGAKTLALSPEERGYRRPPYFEPRKKPPFLICPFCSKRMKEEKLGQTPVDLCEACHALWIDAPKMPKFSDLIGPYKWKMSKSKQGPKQRLSSRMDGDD